MTHKTVVKFARFFNIVCAAAMYYKEMKSKYPEMFEKDEEQEYELAEKLKIFCLETGATLFKIEDAN